MTIAGQLLVARKRLNLAAGVLTNVDTGLTQKSFAFPSGDAPIGVEQALPPADGADPASRVMVIPLAPTLQWAGVTHGEPYLDTDTNTIHVVFLNNSEGAVDINVLFWLPHSGIGPVEADTYNPAA